MESGTEREEETVLDYAAGRKDGKSKWGRAAMICPAVGAIILVMPATAMRAYELASAPGGIPKQVWTRYETLWMGGIVVTVACCIAGIVCGIVGLAQGQRRDSAAMGLFWSVCVLVVLYYVYMH